MFQPSININNNIIIMGGEWQPPAPIIIIQSEASIQVTWSVWTNQRPPEVPGPRGTDRPEMGSLSLSDQRQGEERAMNGPWCHMLLPAHLSQQLSLNIHNVRQ